MIPFLFQDIIHISFSTLVLKTPYEIELALGKSTKIESYTVDGNLCSCQRFYYLNNKLAITYIDGKSDWIWIYPGVELTDVEINYVKVYFNFITYKLYKQNVTDQAGCCVERL